jgi:hypothetical protein
MPSATSQQYFALTTNQPPASSTLLFSQNKPAPAISHQPTEQADLFDYQTLHLGLSLAPQHLLEAEE